MSKTNKRNITRKDVSHGSDEVQDLGILDEDDAAQAFLNRWEDDASLSSDDGKETAVEQKLEDIEDDAKEDLEEDTEAATDDADGEDSDEAQDDSEESTEDEDTEADQESKPGDKKALEDSSEVEIKVDDEVLKVPVKDLKRLYGMEASITKKAQQVAAERKAVEAQTVKYAASLDSLYKKAQTNWEPYSKIDMLVASKELTTEQFAALRKEAQAAYDEFQFVSQEANTFVKQADTQRQETIKVQAAEAVKVLKEKLPSWSPELYDRIRSYASENGIPREAVDQIVDPYAIMLINKARLFDESKKVVLKKKVKTPTKVVRSGSTSGSDLIKDKSQQAFDKLRVTGDSDDAADALLARWTA